MGKPEQCCNTFGKAGTAVSKLRMEYFKCQMVHVQNAYTPLLTIITTKKNPYS